MYMESGGALPLTTFDVLAVSAAIYLGLRIWKWFLLQLPEPAKKKKA